MQAAGHVGNIAARSMLRSDRLTLRLAVFLAGATLMALEVAAFRIIGRTFGSAIRETTTVIAVFLTAMSIGYRAGGWLIDRRPHRRLVALTMAISGAVLFTIPLCDRLLSTLISRSSFAPGAHAFIATTLLFAIPTVLLASISPMATRLFASSVGDTGSVAGGIAALSTFGSIVGTIGTAFFLLEWLESINRTVLFLGCISVATAMLVMVPELTGRRGFIATALLLASAGVIANGLAYLVAGPFDVQPYIEPLNDNNRLLFSRDSAYHHVRVREYNHRERYLYFGLHAQSRMHVGEPYGPGLEYTNLFHMATLFRPDLRRVLFIGVGGGTGPKQFERFYPEVEIDAVDVDPVVLEAASAYFHLRPTPRLRLHAMDAREYLRRIDTKYDLIVIDAYTTNRYGSTIPPHLVTREFFEEARARLTERGMIHFHCAASRSTKMPRALYKTLQSLFPTVVIFGETELLATRASTPPSPDEVARLARGMIESGRWPLPKMQERAATYSVTPPPTDDVPLLTDDYAPVDSLLVVE